MMFLLQSRSAPLLRWQALASLPIAGLVIGLAGPFASYGEIGLVPRVAHFMLCVTVIGGASLIVSYLVARHFFQGFWPLWAALAVDGALVLPGSAVVYGSLGLFAPIALDHVHSAHLIWQNLLVALVFRALSLFTSWQRIRERLPSNGPLPVVTPVAEFSALLPLALRNAPVLSLSSEDHYLRVHTPYGEALIHMTLAAATVSLLDGFQIHRSHWVAKEGIKSVGNSKVELVTGLALPISRHRSKAFQEWLGMGVSQTASGGQATPRVIGFQ